MIKSASFSRWLGLLSFFARIQTDYAHGAWGSRAAQALFEQDLRSEAKRSTLCAVACAVMVLAPLASAEKSIAVPISLLASSSAAPAPALLPVAPPPPSASLAPPAPALAPASADGRAVFDSEDLSPGDFRDAKPFLADLHDVDPLFIILVVGGIFFGLTAGHRHLQMALGSLRPWSIETLSAKLDVAESRWIRAHIAWSREARAARRIALAFGASRARPCPPAKITKSWPLAALARGLWRKATSQNEKV